MKNKLYVSLLTSLLACSSVSQAQTVTFSENFVYGVTNKCTEWNTFVTALNPGSYTSVTMSGSFDMTGITCNDPTIVNDIATAIKNGTSYMSATTNGHTWEVCNRGSFLDVWIDAPSQCNSSDCPNPGYIIRPCIGAYNSGGVNTATCGGPDQTMTLEFIDGPPCPGPGTPFASGVLSSSATINWTAVSGTAGYEYVLNQVATNPTAVGTSTALTSIPVNSLTPSTTYYIHVRNLCTTGNRSPWEVGSFTTLPPCSRPSGFNVTNLMTSSVTINWNPLTSALSWDYIVDQSPVDPTVSTGAVNVIAPTAPLTGLTENTKYYVHIRANCTGEISDWMLDSFVTPIPCRAPKLKVDYVNTTESVVYWDAVPTATQYEYAITKLATPPAVGTVYKATALHIAALNDGVTYYVHVRNQCTSVGITDVSPWASVSFKTFPLSVEDINNLPFEISTYPNPVGDILTIDLKGKIAASSKAQIVDVTGKTLISTDISEHTTTINMSALPAGNYLLKYTDGSHDKSIKVTKK
ncbi:MAG: T9SS type A sorting domain-containing protein [Sphingobacteriales bacterium]|nr:MAG: T9SS type A sorting domain-containing protein [Sphingobacteriales bacterium]